MEMDNVFILRDVISLGGGQVLGRKKLQKIVYIMQEFMGIFDPPFKYRWNYYGVYSYDLAAALDVGKFFDIFTENPVMDYNYQSYALKVNSSPGETAIIKNGLAAWLMQFLNAKEPRLLEVLSSIIYFENEGLSREAIISKLHEFKGHLEYFYEDAYIALMKIREVFEKHEMKGVLP